MTNAVCSDGLVFVAIDRGYPYKQAVSAILLYASRQGSRLTVGIGSVVESLEWSG